MKKRKYEIYDITGKTIIGYAGCQEDDIITKMILLKSPFPLNINQNMNNNEIIIIFPTNIISISVTEI